MDAKTQYMPLDEVFNFLKGIGCIVEPCGSRVTCSPPPEDTDADFLVEAATKDNGETVSSLVNSLSREGFVWEGGEHYQDAASTFMSWRRDGVNLIVTAESDFAMRHRAATALCKKLNLLNKPDRIAAFQAVLYGVAA